MKQFDLVRATFYLIATVVAVHLIIVLMGASMCVYYSKEIVEGKWQCDPKGRLLTILDNALEGARK